MFTIAPKIILIPTLVSTASEIASNDDQVCKTYEDDNDINHTYDSEEDSTTSKSSISYKPLQYSRSNQLSSSQDMSLTNHFASESVSYDLVHQNLNQSGKKASKMLDGNKAIQPSETKKQSTKRAKQMKSKKVSNLHSFVDDTTIIE